MAMLAEVLSPPSSLLEEERRALVSSLAFFDEECDSAKEAAKLLRELLRGIDPIIEDTFPRQTGLLKSIGDWLTTGLEIEDRTARYRRLRASNFELFSLRGGDERPAPQVIMVLSASHLADPALRQSLIDLLAPFRNSFAAFLIVFLDEAGQLLRPESGRRELRNWTQDFTRLSPAGVDLYVLSRCFENGDPIGAEDLAAAVAIALCANIVLPSPHSPRILCQNSSQRLPRLCAFGMKAFWFDPAAAAKLIHTQWIAELLARARFVRKDGNEGPPPVPSRNPVLNRFPSIPPVGLPGEFGVSTLRERLDDRPPSEWGHIIQQWRESVGNNEVPFLAQQFEEQLEAARPAITDGLRQALADSVAAADGPMQLHVACASLEQSVNLHMQAPSPSPPRAVSNESVEAALANLTTVLMRRSSPRDLFVAGIILSLPLVLAGLVRLTNPAHCSSWLTASGAAFIVIAGVLCWYRRQTERSIGRNRDQAIALIRSEGEAALAAKVTGDIKIFRESVSAQIASLRSEIESICAGLRNIGNDERDQENTPLAIVKLPMDHATAQRLKQLLQQQEAFSAADSDFQFFAELRKNVLHVLRGQMTAKEAVEKVRGGVEDKLNIQCQRLSLWHFFRSAPEAASDAADAASPRTQFDRLRQHPCVYLQGWPVEDGLAQPDRSTRVALAPALMHSFLPRGLLPIETLLENIAAVFTSVELARADETGCPGKRESTEAFPRLDVVSN